MSGVQYWTKNKGPLTENTTQDKKWLKVEFVRELGVFVAEFGV